MPLLCHVLYEGAAYMAVLKNFLCLFYYLRIIRRADYQAEITVVSQTTCFRMHIFQKSVDNLKILRITSSILV